jgi:hypothetical protein
MGNRRCHETDISDFVYFCTYMSCRLIEHRGRCSFKGEGFVTPCFPQSVKITILAKNYGRLKDVNA